MDATETWTPIPGHTMYEATSDGLVQSWKRPANSSSKAGRASKPHILRGHSWQGDTFFNLDGESVSLPEIVARVFGEDAALATLATRERILSQYERSEIRSNEGFKAARDVALEFRIDPRRVRELWDSTE